MSGGLFTAEGQFADESFFVGGQGERAADAWIVERLAGDVEPVKESAEEI